MNEHPGSIVEPGIQCPSCGVRVSQRAEICFMCGAQLHPEQQRGRNLPWTDVLLLLVTIFAAAIWWTRANNEPPLVAALAFTPTPALESTATSSVVPTPTESLLAISTPVPQETPAAEVLYKVSAGDTLLGIASKFGVSLDAILNANQLNPSSILAIGQSITIPKAGAKSDATRSVKLPTATPTPDTSTLIYRVSEGDTLSGIAAKFKSSLALILQANKLDPSATIHIGQVLIVPRAPLVPTTEPTPIPSPTATPGMAIPAPMLLGPANGAVLKADEPVVLRWTAAGTLSEEDWYVVDLKSLSTTAAPIPPFFTKGTSLRIESTLRLPAYVRERTWQWQVTIERHPGRQENAEPTPTTGNALGLQLSVPSEIRTFIWE